MPPRFCPQCGTQATADAKFCTGCGVQLAGGGRTVARAPGGWQPTSAGLGVLALFLVGGLGIWTLILQPAPQAPRLTGGATAAGTPAGALPPDHPQIPRELPAEVRTFIDDLAAKAKATPDDLAAWTRLGQVYFRGAQFDPALYDRAKEAFDHVLARDAKNTDALRGRANVAYDREQHADAIRDYEAYLALQPDDPSARTDVATMYLYSGDATKAIATYRDVIARNPSFLQAHYNLAVTYHQQGQRDEALAELRVARDLATDEPVRKQIDDMIVKLGGTTPPVGTAPAASPAAAPVTPPTDRSPYQRAVEEGLRAQQILGPRITAIDWADAVKGQVRVDGFPMDGMPPMARDKFVDRLRETMRDAASKHDATGTPSLEIVDAASGRVMASVER